LEIDLKDRISGHASKVIPRPSLWTSFVWQTENQMVQWHTARMELTYNIALTFGVLVCLDVQVFTACQYTECVTASVIVLLEKMSITVLYLFHAQECSDAGQAFV